LTKKFQHSQGIAGLSEKRNFETQETAYEPIGEAAYARALAVMEQCETVCCTQTHFGVVNQKNVDLKNVALQTGKLQV
jgi:hypothetical protein